MKSHDKDEKQFVRAYPPFEMPSADSPDIVLDTDISGYFGVAVAENYRIVDGSVVVFWDRGYKIVVDNAEDLAAEAREFWEGHGEWDEMPCPLYIALRCTVNGKRPARIIIPPMQLVLFG